MTEKEGAQEVCIASVPRLPLRAAAEDGQRQGGGPGGLQIRVRMSWGGKSAGECPPPPFPPWRSSSRRVSVAAVFAIQSSTHLVRLSSLLCPVVPYHFTGEFVYSTFGAEPCIPFWCCLLRTDAAGENKEVNTGENAAFPFCSEV